MGKGAWPNLPQKYLHPFPLSLHPSALEMTWSRPDPCSVDFGREAPKFWFEFCCGFWSGLVPPVFFPRKKAPKNSTKNPPRNSPRKFLSGKPPDSAEAFSWWLSRHCVPELLAMCILHTHDVLIDMMRVRSRRGDRPGSRSQERLPKGLKLPLKRTDGHWRCACLHQRAWIESEREDSSSLAAWLLGLGTAITRGPLIDFIWVQMLEKRWCRAHEQSAKSWRWGARSWATFSLARWGDFYMPDGYPIGGRWRLQVTMGCKSSQLQAKSSWLQEHGIAKKKIRIFHIVIWIDFQEI